ncbi:MAG: hypothetical protein MJ252_22650, partial [archaeon]|nr:hypothetical protein [archaeon]
MPYIQQSLNQMGIVYNNTKGNISELNPHRIMDLFYFVPIFEAASKIEFYFLSPEIKMLQTYMLLQRESGLFFGRAPSREYLTLLNATYNLTNEAQATTFEYYSWYLEENQTSRSDYKMFNRMNHNLYKFDKNTPLEKFIHDQPHVFHLKAICMVCPAEGNCAVGLTANPLDLIWGFAFNLIKVYDTILMMPYFYESDNLDLFPDTSLVCLLSEAYGGSTIDRGKDYKYLHECFGQESFDNAYFKIRSEDYLINSTFKAAQSLFISEDDPLSRIIYSKASYPDYNGYNIAVMEYATVNKFSMEIYDFLGETEVQANDSYDYISSQKYRILFIIVLAWRVLGIIFIFITMKVNKDISQPIQNLISAVQQMNCKDSKIFEFKDDDNINDLFGTVRNLMMGELNTNSKKNLTEDYSKEKSNNILVNHELLSKRKDTDKPFLNYSGYILETYLGARVTKPDDTKEEEDKNTSYEKNIYEVFRDKQLKIFFGDKKQKYKKNQLNEWY